MAASRRWLNFVVLLGLVWAATAGILLAGRWPEMSQRLFDADDAMRLVEVREFLSGRGWFDLHEPRIDPIIGYDTHWSRLIDAGLAGLFLVFRPFADPGLAERLMRAVWPLLWLLAAMGGATALAWRIAGRNAALIGLVLAACAVPAFQHFQPGRIDHHNVQIALALAVLAAVAWSDRARQAAALAGALTGFAAAVGLESLPFLAVGGAALALRFAQTAAVASPGTSAPEPSAQALASYGCALAASASVGFLLNVAPEHWTRAACDAIAINWLVVAVVAGLGLAVAAGALRQAGTASRIAAIVLTGGAAILAFVLVEPRCIRGPFALTDGVVKAIWLDHVDEMEPLVGFVRGFPLVGAWMCSFPLIGLVSGALLARRREMRRDFGFLVAAAAFVASVAATLEAEKIYAYAMWFAMPLVAAFASRLIAAPGRRANLARLATALAVTPTTVTAVAITVIQAVSDGPVKPGIAERIACTRNEAYRLLAQLPPGLVATEINYGPFVLALTPHAVVAAPYHRISAGMIAAYTILSAPPEDARRVADAYGVSYVAICGRRASTGDDPAEGSLWAEVNADRAPPWLDKIPDAREAPFTVYRVRH
jgi:hypothetical protein